MALELHRHGVTIYLDGVLSSKQDLRVRVGDTVVAEACDQLLTDMVVKQSSLGELLFQVGQEWIAPRQAYPAIVHGSHALFRIGHTKEVGSDVRMKAPVIAGTMQLIPDLSS